MIVCDSHMWCHTINLTLSSKNEKLSQNKIKIQNKLDKIESIIFNSNKKGQDCQIISLDNRKKYITVDIGDKCQC